jgi:hypothetical protein
MLSNLLKLWMWGARAYALLCIAATIAVWTFHAAYPEFQGIPRWLYLLVWFPATGIIALPVIFAIDLILGLKGIYRRPSALVQAILEAAAFFSCLQGLRQAPAAPPQTGITVTGGGAG